MSGTRPRAGAALRAALRRAGAALRLAAARRRLGAPLLGAALGLATVAVYAYPAPQSHVVETTSRGADIAFAGGELSVWEVTRATLCRSRRAARRAGAELPAAAPDEAPGCDPALHVAVPLERALLAWPEGARVRLRTSAGGGLAVQVALTPETGGPQPGGEGSAVLAGDLLLIAPDDWAEHPPLPFSASALSIGTLPGAGRDGILLEGRFETRQALPLTGVLGRTGPITVREGPLFRGDGVSFRPGPAVGWAGLAPEPGYRVHGFVSPGAAPDGFAAVAYTALARTQIRIGRLGSEPAHVDASWTDRAARDPALLALATIFGLVAICAPFLAALNGRKDAGGPD